MRERTNLRQKVKKMFAAALTATTVMSMAACGGSEEESQSDTATKEWVYVPTYLAVEDENADFYRTWQVGDGLYYVSYGYNEETYESYQDLCMFSLADHSITKVPVAWAEQTGNWNMQNFAVAEDGSLVASMYVYNISENGDYDSGEFLCKFDAEGKQIFTVNLEELFAEDPENSYVQNLVLDGEGRIYMIGGSCIWLYEADGTYRGTVSTGNGMGGWISAAGLGKDGKVYISAYNLGGTEGVGLAAVDFEAKKLGDVYQNFPDGNQYIVPGAEKDFLVSNGDALYEYDLATQTKTEVLQWLDCDINGSYVQSYGALSDGRIYAVVNDWNTGDSEVAVMTRTQASEVVQKETIVIGCLYSDSDIKAAAVKFNKSNDKYRVSIRNYIDYDSYSETSYQDAYNRLLSDITSNNSPDIIGLSGLNLKQLAAKDVFEDLTPYLESGSALKKEDFVESVINAYTVNGKLVSIPATFEMSTIVGATEKLGEMKSWTLEEMVAFADKYPEADVFDNVTKETLLYILLQFCEEDFIDWNTGECKFDNDNFKNLLKFANRFPDDYNYSEDAPSTPTRIQNGEVLLDTANIYNWESIQIYWEMFGGDVTCIGFPTAEGTTGTALMGSGAYAIASESDKKEGAWEFIESYLTKEDSDYWMGFPSLKSQLNAMKEEATKVEYVLDENGEIMLDENGEPMTYGGGSGIGYQDGWEYTYTIPTQKEVDIILSLMEDAVPVSYSSDEWLNIIQEESASFFAGQKSVDEVATIIQGRIQIYVDENR